MRNIIMKNRVIFLDTETTGLSPKSGDRIVEIACIEMQGGIFTGRKFQTYTNPEREVSDGASKVNGLTYEMLKDKPRFSEIYEYFIGFLKDTVGASNHQDVTKLIIHNAPFDLGFINYEIDLMSNEDECSDRFERCFQIVDTRLMAKKLHPEEKHNLDNLCKVYNVDNSNRQIHGALLDCELLAKVYLGMEARNEKL